jgi:DNA replication protein DnaC
MRVTLDIPCGAFTPEGRCTSIEAERELAGDFIEFTCPECGGFSSQHVQTATPDARRNVLEERAGFPAMFAKRRVDEDDSNRRVLSVLRGWTRDYAEWRSRPEEERGPLPKTPALYGEAGRGKSHLLVAWCRLLIRECAAPVMFRSAAGLLDDLQHSFGDHREHRAIWERATTVEILALDDLGAEDPTGWRVDRLARLVDERYQHSRPILMATNYPPELWEARLDERTISRLSQMCWPLELSGPDRRRQEV